MANQPVDFSRPTVEPIRAGFPWLQPVLSRIQASIPWLRPSLRGGQKAPAWLWGLLLLGLLGILVLAADLGARASASPGSVTEAGGVVDTVGLGLSALFKLCLVLGLLYASLGLYKRYRGAIPGIQGRQITILESSRLSPRQAVHLIQVRDQTLLIGATDQGLTLLAEIEAQPAGLEAGQADFSLSANTAPSFEQSLSRLQNLKPGRQNQRRNRQILKRSRPELGEPGGLNAT
jgi:flagellar biogenesis protein FliO